MELELLELEGSPYQLGHAHGRRYEQAIRRFAEERVALAGAEAWTGRKLSREEVLALAQACLPAHEEFVPEGMRELEGMAAATGLSLAELIVVNGFTDFVDTVYAAGGPAPGGPTGSGSTRSGPAPGASTRSGATSSGATPPGATTEAADDCTAVLVPAARAERGQAILGQTWDMHASAAEHVLLLRGRPDGAPEFLTFTSVGCVGMIGMNEAGLVVGINNLMGGDGQPGVTWTFVVRELLRRETVAQALELLEGVPLAGAHNYLLLDRTGNGVNVEATGTRRQVTTLEREALVHTNHCLYPETQAVERERPPSSLAASQARLARASELLNTGTVTPERLQALTADEPTICVSPRPPLQVATCGAAVMRPATGEFWAVKGYPSKGSYRRYTVPA